MAAVEVAYQLARLNDTASGANGTAAAAPGDLDLSEQELLDCRAGNQCNGAWPSDYLNE